MIIAGFAGVGKTYFCEKTRNAMDFVVMPFKYSNFYEVSKNLSEEEDIKAHEDLELALFWEGYYYYALLDTYKQYPDEILVIPTVNSILKRLKQEGIPFTVVCPDATDKEEYERRYKARGNSDTFMEIFIGQWDMWMESLQQVAPENTIILSVDKYLSDVIEQMPYEGSKIILDKENYIYDTYFRNGLVKEFLQTPTGQWIRKFTKQREEGVYG